MLLNIPLLQHANIIGDFVGLRPGRDPLRIERENRIVQDGTKTVSSLRHISPAKTKDGMAKNRHELTSEDWFNELCLIGHFTERIAVEDKEKNWNLYFLFITKGDCFDANALHHHTASICCTQHRNITEP